MKPRDLIPLIEELPRQPPITTSFEIALSDRYGGGGGKTWYTSQRQHLIGWLQAYDGPGAYNRKVHEGRDACFMYNHIMCPPMALWLGEAVGVPEKLVREAAAAALAAGPQLPAQNGAIRKVIPWGLIEARLREIAAIKEAKAGVAAEPQTPRTRLMAQAKRKQRALKLTRPA